MTAAVHRQSTPSLSVPPSQNTAPVLEFNCLYTHDIRRKQKRWQDGFLRFHTFNKRVMVYDVPRNFIGDMHWKADEALREGDEVTLEKDAVLVQVSESVGRTETDLTELKQSAKKSRRVDGGGERGAETPGRTAATPSRVMGPPLTRPSTASVAGGHTQLKHRSLNALLGTPKGRIGKAALPSKSPFEERQAEENEEWESGRPAKRSKAEPWNVTRTTTVPTPRKETPLWKRTSEARVKAAKKTPLPPGQRKLGTKEVIDLSDDGEDSPSRFLPGFSSDAIGPGSSPVREVPAPIPRPSVRSANVRSSSPVFQTQKTVPSKRKDKSPQPQSETPSRPEKRAHVEPAKKADKAPQREPSPPPIAPPFLPPPSNTRASQTLRMATSAPKRKTLACLDSPRAGSSERPTTAESSRPAPSKRKTQRELLEERLAKMNRMAKQRADDLNALVDDFEATENELQQIDDEPAPSRRTESPPNRAAPEEIGELSRRTLPRAESPEKEPIHEEPEIPDRNDRFVDTSMLSRRTDPPQEEPPSKKPDRPFRRVVSERGTGPTVTSAANRVPGAPVRFTPSPTMRAARLAEQEKQKPESVPPIRIEQQQRPKQPQKPHTSPPMQPVSAAKPALAQRKETIPDPEVELPAPQAQSPPAKEMPPPPARRRPGVGRKEIRKSAQACFPTALNVAANGTSTVMLGKPFQAPRPPAQPKAPPSSVEAGPWTHEAFDLFTWRPPGWNEEKWCVDKSDGDVAP